MTVQAMADMLSMYHNGAGWDNGSFYLITNGGVLYIRGVGPGWTRDFSISEAKTLLRDIQP